MLKSPAGVYDPLPHGGRLNVAVQAYGIPLPHWQDLSTGISPWSWPVPAQIPSAVWRNLPENDELCVVAAEHYHCAISNCIPVAGSQVAIRQIPQLLPAARVAVPRVGYQEHRLSWQLAGHEVAEYSAFDELRDMVCAGDVQHIVVINPNNPTAEFWLPRQLEQLSAELLRKAGPNAVILVDEAFADSRRSEDSVIASELENVIVLRSLGKFYGLAGLRLGFVIGRHPSLAALRTLLEPWSVSSPAVYLGTMALRDKAWQTEQRQRLSVSSSQLQLICEKRFSSSTICAGDLFVTIFDSAEVLESVHTLAAENGLLLRYGSIDATQSWIRVGLADDGFARLQQHWNR